MTNAAASELIAAYFPAISASVILGILIESNNFPYFALPVRMGRNAPWRRCNPVGVDCAFGVRYPGCAFGDPGLSCLTPSGSTARAAGELIAMSHAEGVAHQSPGSRSAPWERRATTLGRTPTGFHHPATPVRMGRNAPRRLCNPVGVDCAFGVRYPGCAFGDPGLSCLTPSGSTARAAGAHPQPQIAAVHEGVGVSTVSRNGLS